MPFTTFRASPLPFLAATGALGLLFVSLLTGQLLRLPLPGQGGGLLLSDIATLCVLLAAFIFFLFQPRGSKPIFIILTSLLPFILWVVAGTVIAASHYALPEAGLITAYAVRLVSTLLLFPALLLFVQDIRLEKLVHHSLVMVVSSVAILGLVQWLFIRDLTFLTQWGWDPHQGRLVSTWLDPNFVGIFFAMMLPWFIARKSWWVVGIMPALLLTSSRSSFVALALAVLCLSPFLLLGLLKQAKHAAFIITSSIAGLSLIALVIAILLLGSRAQSLLKEDPTVNLRLDSLHTAWNVIENHPWVGVGYNAYQFAGMHSTQQVDFSIHSRAGADNSYLTLWATTGLIGLFLFLAPVAAMAIFLLKQWLIQSDFIAFSIAVSLLTLLIHANFINSLLYTHLLIALFLLLSRVKLYVV